MNEWEQKGYELAKLGYPALDNVWGTKNFPTKHKKEFRKGQIKAWKEGKANKPWFMIK